MEDLNIEMNKSTGIFATSDNLDKNYDDKKSVKRNYNIDLLKIFACIAVIGLHVTQLNFELFTKLFHSLCGFAIPVFFFCSGYILCNRKFISYKYILNKIIRIVIIVFMWNFIIESMLFLTSLVNIGSYDFTITNFLSNITYKPFLQKGNTSQFWYMGAMILVYLFLPIFHKIASSQKKRWLYIWLLFFTISSIIEVLSLLFGHFIQKDIIQTFRLWTWLQYLTLGGAMTYIGPKINKIFSKKNHLIILAIYSILLIAYQYFIGSYMKTPFAEYYYDSFFEGIWIILLTSFVIRLKLNETFIKIIKILAPLTFGVYAIHKYAISLFIHFITVNSTIISLLCFIVTIVLSFLISFIISKIPLVKRLLRI